MKFGEFLHSNNLINENALEDALKVQRFCYKPIGRILRDLGHIDAKTLDTSLSKYLNLTFIAEVSDLEKALKAVKLTKDLQTLEETFETRIFAINDDCVLAVCTEYKEEFLEKVEAATGTPCRVFLIECKLYKHLESIHAKYQKQTNTISIHRGATSDEKISDSSPYTKLFSECIKTALARRASDIHIEPTENGLKILLRIFGDRQLWKTLPKDHRDPFTSKVKQIVNLPLASLGKPTDSRASFNDLKLDVRANATPMLDGEKIVLRLLRQDKTFQLTQSGLSHEVVETLSTTSQQHNGLILIAGPTGSGKTTTLYSLLGSLDSQRLNVSTIENPVEYRMQNLNQIDINETSEMKFSHALRALMRQDPDVILVGEIRDEETAELCFKAASTGHLVFSTIHANGAVEVIERLKILGIDDLSIRSNLRFSGAQRLVKRICPHCSTLSQDKFRIKNTIGCNKCEKGITGLSAIMEYLTQDNIPFDVAKTVLSSKSLKEQTIVLAKNGEVCAREVGLIREERHHA